ncbi:MAG: hypothetical protein JNK68_10970 [Betaproteobacteria bacterium]|nr:hypothetical protein [Betaproteobacteria bacterium]
MIQRFGSAGQLERPPHCLVLEGVYRSRGDSVPSFVEVNVLQTLTSRLMKLLTRRGVPVEDMGQSYLAEPMPAGPRRARWAAAGGGHRTIRSGARSA